MLPNRIRLQTRKMRALSAKCAMALYRRRRFRSLAVCKHLLLLVFTSVSFLFVLQMYHSSESVIQSWAKPLAALFAVLIVVTDIYYLSRSYQRRYERAEWRREAWRLKKRKHTP